MAVRRFQQSPMLGHAALSHTVCRSSFSHQFFQIAIVFADRRGRAQPGRPRSALGSMVTSTYFYCSNCAIRFSIMRDSSKFSARRKNAGACSKARRGMNPINWLDAMLVPRRAASAAIAAYKLVERSLREIGQIHRTWAQSREADAGPSL